MTRVNIILDLFEKLSNCIRLHFVDEKPGKLIEVFQEVVYDNYLCIAIIVSTKVVMNKATTLDRQLVVATSKQNRADSMNIDTRETPRVGVDVLPDNEKRQEISNVSRNLLCLNNFDALLNATGKDGNIMVPTLYLSNPESLGESAQLVRSTKNDNDSVQEEQKIKPEALFVAKCLIAKKNDSKALTSNTIDLGEDFLDEDGEELDI
ncbi:hypothetical protein H5410_042663 [Solanum commersonii]|uniref:Uncharacterized protein n=1 Tax=Solanum commersonii TaxID=4109 RepID=A0A9J5XWC0_SOLCO|nr:hypothetical protein H5410_042663 [Solanum commersonii]